MPSEPTAANRRELDDEAVRRASLIAVDSLEQARRNPATSFKGLPMWGEAGKTSSSCTRS